MVATDKKIAREFLSSEHVTITASIHIRWVSTFLDRLGVWNVVYLFQLPSVSNVISERREPRTQLFSYGQVKLLFLALVGFDGTFQDTHAA